MSTKKELLAQVRAIDSEQADQLVSTKATKPVIEAWLADAKASSKPDEDDEPRTMPKTLAKYRKSYKPTIASSGRKSLNNGDGVALLLAGLTPEEVLTAAEELLGLATGELATKYQHLNDGQRRMNGGNRIRAAIKRGDVTEDQLTAAILH